MVGFTPDGIPPAIVYICTLNLYSWKTRSWTRAERNYQVSSTKGGQSNSDVPMDTSAADYFCREHTQTARSTRVFYSLYHTYHGDKRAGVCHCRHLESFPYYTTEPQDLCPQRSWRTFWKGYLSVWLPTGRNCHQLWEHVVSNAKRS